MAAGTGFPASVEGQCEPCQIAELFKEHFRVDTPLGPLAGVLDIKPQSCDEYERFTSKEASTVIHDIRGGKSPGHDGLNVEHLR